MKEIFDFPLPFCFYLICVGYILQKHSEDETKPDAPKPDAAISENSATATADTHAPYVEEEEEDLSPFTQEEWEEHQAWLKAQWDDDEGKNDFDYLNF